MPESNENYSVLLFVSGRDPKHVKGNRTTPSGRSHSGTSTLSCSGTWLDHNNLLLAPATIFVPFLVQSQRVDIRKAWNGEHQLLDGTRISCHYNGGLHEACIQSIKPIVGAEEILKSILNGKAASNIRIGWSKEATDSLGQCDVSGSIVLLSVDVENILDVSVEASKGTENTANTADQITQEMGNLVFVHGVPFGALLGTKFHSARAQGVVSAVLRSPKGLLNDIPTVYLLDVNILPGMEGGAVLDEEQRLVGMVGEPIIASEVGAIFHLAWPIQNLLDLFSIKRINRTRMSEAECQVQRSPLDRVSCNLSSVVVGVEDGYSWASGLFLPADGLILTNAHAISSKSQGTSNEMRVYMPFEKRYFSGMLLHSFSRTLDLAVLKIIDTYSSELNIENPIFTKDTLRQGVSILSAGFPLWRPSSPHQMHSALSMVKVTGGQITSILYDDEHHVAAFTTNSKVINGSSGGPVFEHGTGDIIGLITSNTKILQHNYSKERNTVSSEKTIFPCLNYCIPSNILLAAVESVKHGKIDIFEHRLEMAGITGIWQSMDKYEMENSQNSKL